MKKFHLFSLLVLLVMGMTACKYEEGPFVSFVSRTERVANTWVVNSGTINGSAVTSIPNFKQIICFKEGACNIIFDPLGVEVGYTGTWVFSDDQSSIHIDVVDDLFNSDHYISDWTILHLKDKIFKVSFTDDGDDYIIEFKAAV